MGSIIMLANKNRPLIVTSLLYVITLCTLHSFAWADKGVNEIPRQPATITLQITDGVVSGYIKGVSIREVLEVISSQHPFDYQANELLFKQRISGQFDKVPLLAALRQLLKPFNYYLIFSKETGDIESLTLTSIHVASDSHPRPLIASPRADVSDNTFTELLAELDTGEADHPSFIMEGEETEPPQALLDSFYPVQEPGGEITGPQAPPDMLIEELPMVDVIENDTGPVDPTITSEENRVEFAPFPQ